MLLRKQAPVVARTQAYVKEIAGLGTQFDVFHFMKRMTEAFGSRAFMVMNLPSVTSSELQSSSIISSWPAELLSIYDQEGFVATSPVMRRLRSSAVPFISEILDVAAERNDERTQFIVSLFARFRMQRCAFFPTQDFSGLRGAISFAGDREPFTLEEMMALTYISIHVFNRLAEIRNIDNRVADNLNDREIDCLNWTAAGKTSAEIAEILGLSEHTVNHYLNRATKKLNTVSRTQAVAKALRVGLIK